ncbi:MAG: hypothetical protein ACOX6V_00800 [Patescibacteria group bacterium]
MDYVLKNKSFGVKFDLNRTYPVRTFLNQAKTFASLYINFYPQYALRFKKWIEWAETLPQEADIYFDQDGETGEVIPIATVEDLELGTEEN